MNESPVKYCLIIPDGAADFPAEECQGRTPLQAAAIPNMDRAAREGLLGVVSTSPPHIDPGSDIAIMSLMGYDPEKYYTGRAPLEAADLGIEMEANELAFRCNLINVEDGRLTDFSAGHISTDEAAHLIETLNAGLNGRGCVFHTGTGYRHLMLYEDGGGMDILSNPPHQVMGEPLEPIWPSGRGADRLIDIMKASGPLLRDHPVNRSRTGRSLPAANMIWLWGEGRPPKLEPFRDIFGLQGAAISAVNLVRGIARLIGWRIVNVPGITGYLDTNYQGKGQYALDALSRYDLVLVHIEAPDEASHEGNAGAKIEAIEQIDRHVVGPVMEYGEKNGRLRLLVLPDHVTSFKTRRHMRGDVPLAMWGEGIDTASNRGFNEADAHSTDIAWKRGFELMPCFLDGRLPES